MSDQLRNYLKFDGRGRPRRNQWLRKIIVTIVLLAEKYGLKPKKVVDAFFEAKRKEISRCGTLKITCREMNEDSATFLINEGEKVVAQFPVQLEFFKNIDLLIKEILKIEFERESWKGRSARARPRKRKIAELEVGLKANIHGKIIEKSPKKTVFTQWSGPVTLSNITIADDSGKVGFCLWNEQIDKFHVGDEVEIKNCRVATFAGKLQLKFRRKNMTLKTLYSECRDLGKGYERIRIDEKI